MRVQTWLVALSLCVVACGGGGGGGELPDAASASDAARGNDAAAAPDSATSDGGAAAMPGSPVLLSAMTVVHGTIALAWNLPASGCDEVVINRNQNGGSYSEVQRITGVATDAEASAGHASGTFCFTISCVLGGVTGDPSNERCITQ